MTTRPAVFLAALALVASSACARHHAEDVAPAPVPDTASFALVRDTLPPGAGEVREYRGAYSSGYEISWFQPCDAPRDDSMWWVTLSEDARLQRDSLLKLLPVQPRHGLAVRWRRPHGPRLALHARHPDPQPAPARRGRWRCVRTGEPDRRLEGVDATIRLAGVAIAGCPGAAFRRLMRRRERVTYAALTLAEGPPHVAVIQ